MKELNKLQKAMLEPEFLQVLQQHLNNIASPNELGHVKVGQNLTISPDGTLNASGGTVPDASTTQKGVVQLNNTLTSTSTTQAATANAVKQVNDKLEGGPWISIPRPNENWWEYDIKYRKSGSVVHVCGSFGLENESTSDIARLPVGYRPPKLLTFFISGGDIPKAAIKPTGEIIWLGDEPTIEENRMFNFALSFPVA